VFPVVNIAGELTGILLSDRLLELLVSNKPEDQDRLIKDIAQPPDRTINIDTPMYEVMGIMDRQDTRILPVVGANNTYLGFVSKNGIFNKYRHILKRQGQYMQ
jgi:CIC family chloride channel protein